MSEVKISISIDNTHLSQIQKVSQELQLLGMNVEQTLASIGVISGSIQSEKFNSLSQIEGVKNIEAQESYKLPPPSSGPQ